MIRLQPQVSTLCSMGKFRNAPGTKGWSRRRDIVVPDTVAYPALQVVHSIQRNFQDFSVFPGS